MKKDTLSKVCSIANRIPKTVSRKEAFIQAWRIVKAGGIKIPVAGVTFENRQEALRRIALYASKNIHALLVPEPDNQYDSNAIAVKVLAQGARTLYKIGYIPASQTQMAKAFIGKEPQIQIIGGEVYSARLNIGFRRKNMSGIEIIGILDQIKDQKFTYNELVREGIKVTLDKHTYLVYDIEKLNGSKAYGYGENENGIEYNLLFYYERGYDCYSLVEATKINA